MSRSTDIRPQATALYFLPIQTRLPLKFGTGTVTSVTCARARLTIADGRGQSAEGWGETPLSVQWVWPSKVPYEEREEALKNFCVLLAKEWTQVDGLGHPLEVGYDFQETVLPGLLEEFNREQRGEHEPMPWLAALVCCSVFDLALHDAYGQLHQRPVYELYGPAWINRDLASFLTSAEGTDISFEGKFVEEFLVAQPQAQLPAWHLVGGLDLLDAVELTGREPRDGYPVLLTDWIKRDGLTCLKVKLRGDDSHWDYQRMVKVGKIALANGVEHLSADFNCTVTDPAYVNDILDRLRSDQPPINERLLYVEQPFP
ncbi:MAG TPA: hypothetical protein VFA77_03000, partial [Candidatus Eisenbacteria bacterium]|nr:hypothetical protein [Candidatus Eisenbacteria bacterium]